MILRGLLIIFLVAVTAGRCWFALECGVAPQAAFHFLCSQKLDWAFHDGPPGMALMVAAASQLGHSWWLLLGPFWALATSVTAWWLGTKTSNESASFMGVVALNLLPEFNLASQHLAPLLPATALTLAGLACSWSAIRIQKGGTLTWIAAALSFATAAIFSYWVAPVAMSLAILPWIKEKFRRPPQILGSALVLISCLFALMPGVIWCASKQWQPFAGWTLKGLIEPNADDLWNGTLNLFWGVTPLILVMAIWTLFRSLASAASQPPYLLAGMSGLMAALPASLYYWRGWDASPIALPSLAITMAPMFQIFCKNKWLLAIALANSVGFSALALAKQYEVNRIHGQASAHILSLDKRLSPQLGDTLFMIGGDQLLASSLGYHLKDLIIPPKGHPLAYRIESQGLVDQFSYWPSYADFIESESPPDESFTEQIAINPFIGASAFYLGTESPSQLPQTLKSAFQEVELIRKVGEGKHALYLYLCINYQTLPL